MGEVGVRDTQTEAQMRKFSLTCLLLLGTASALAGAPLSDAERQALHRQTAICDADTSADGMVCNPAYARLIQHYGSYEAFIEASRAWKTQRG